MARHLSIEDVADRAHVHPNYLRYLESTATLPSIKCLRDLALALGTSIPVLLGAGEDCLPN